MICWMAKSNDWEKVNILLNELSILVRLYIQVSSFSFVEGTVIGEVNQLENPSISTHSSASLSPQTSSLANVTNVEPLPPGVDLTEAPYELPATALKRIIYSTVQPQGGTLYEATARDPTVSILSHPAAIVQEHYLQYPAYHQHLHSVSF